MDVFLFCFDWTQKYNDSVKLRVIATTRDVYPDGIWSCMRLQTTGWTDEYVKQNSFR